MDLLQGRRNHQNVGNVADVTCHNHPENMSGQMEFGVGDEFQSPTISDRSLIFERDVQDDPFLFPHSSNTTLTSLTVHDLSKQRSNSNVSLNTQKTIDSATTSNHSFNGNNNSPPLVPPSVSIFHNRRLSRANSSASFSNPLLSPLSKSTSHSPSFISSSNSNNNNHIFNSFTEDGFHHQRRMTLENSVAPALDASCSLIAEDDTDIADVNIIHSRSSSTIGLDMALGRVSSHSQSSNNHSDTNNTHISHIGTQQDWKPDNNESKVLNFYSYNDLLNDEKIKEIHLVSNPSKRPSLGMSKSAGNFKIPTSPLQKAVNNNSNSITNNPHFLNPFAAGRVSSPCLSPQQQSRKYSFNNGTTPFSKSPTSSSNTGIADTLTNNINNTSSVLLQDPISTGNVTPSYIKNHLNKSIGRDIAQSQYRRKHSKDTKLTESMSKFHLASSESESECDSECEKERDKDSAVTNEEDDYDGDDDDDVAVSGYYPGHGVGGFVVSQPIRIKNLRSFSNSSNKNTSFLLKTTNFLDSKNKSSSVIKLQQHYDTNLKEPIDINNSIPVEDFQLQRERIGDMIKNRVLSSKQENN